MLVENIDRIL